LIERVVPLVLGGLLAQAACRPEASEDIWHVRFTHVYTSASDYQLMAERIRDLMDERTDGRFRVVIYPSAQLGGERVGFEQLQAGATYMAISGTPVLSGWVPEGQIFDLPFAFETRAEGLQVLNGPLGDWWREQLLERTGVRSIGFLDYGFRHVYNSKRPIHEPSDLAGLKLRVLQNATYLSAYEAFGVQATPMSYGEVYSALQQGVIDGGEANVIGFVTDRFSEVGNYFSFTSITYNPITLLVNDRFYRSLPEDVQRSLDRSAAEALAYQSEVARELERDAIAEMESAGVVVSRPSLDAFEPVVRPRVWEELASRLEGGDELLERLRQETGRVRKVNAN
jgi:C4-dicarboxylate-binding protein DctP